MSSKLTVGTPNLWVKRSALQIAESDGVHSKSSNLMVYSPNQSRCESKCYDSNEGGGRNIEAAWSPEIDMSDIQKPLRDSEIEGVFNSMTLG